LIRTVLSEEQWERIAPLLPGKEGDPGRSGGNRSLTDGHFGIGVSGLILHYRLLIRFSDDRWFLVFEVIGVVVLGVIIIVVGVSRGMVLSTVFPPGPLIRL
jgi:hypothetical protein